MYFLLGYGRLGLGDNTKTGSINNYFFIARALLYEGVREHANKGNLERYIRKSRWKLRSLYIKRNYFFVYQTNVIYFNGRTILSKFNSI